MDAKELKRWNLFNNEKLLEEIKNYSLSVSKLFATRNEKVKSILKDGQRVMCPLSESRRF